VTKKELKEIAITAAITAAASSVASIIASGAVAYFITRASAKKQEARAGQMTTEGMWPEWPPG
jgi:hypothetical protein